MRDLRKQALLESGKTASRKSRSKTNTPSERSPASSRANSRPSTPRHGSRDVSDDESEQSDTTQWSTNSIDEIPVADIETELTTAAWITNIEDRIDEICSTRKGTASSSRETTLESFIKGVTRHYANQELAPKADELVPALLKSVKSGATEREIALACKALALILITMPSEKIYDTIEKTVKQTITDGEHPSAKIAAIHTLSIATFYGGATLEETQDVMDFFLDIVSTDGNLINATDNAEVVVAALEEWGFLATQLEDMEDSTEVAMDTFFEQLDSTDASVQLAVADNIALLFEKSYTEAESDEEIDEEDNEEKDLINGNKQHMIKRYTVFRQQHLLEKKLSALANISGKKANKKDKKALHRTFKDVLNTVEKPTRGPRYSTALDEDGREYASRMKVKIGDGQMVIDKWEKLHRLNGLKRLLQEGFLVHYDANEVVFDTLPVVIRSNSH